jgi:Cdc6-like AAA superfamily ATPase/nitrogen fixation-related uncharacterized protein
MTSNRIFSDDPIKLGNLDELGRGPFVEQMTTVLSSASQAGSSSVFGLVGPWGSGKSSVLNLLSFELRRAGQPWKVVEFNPWSYPDETSMQLGFFAELRSVLPKTGKPARAREALGNLSTTLAPVAGVLGGLAGVDGSALFSSLGALLSGDASASNAYKEASAALAQTSTPILMIIDDLDRLDPQELVLVAKLVRLVGRLPNVYYLLSYDEGTLLDVLARTPLVGERQSRAKDYLEKIIQMRFDLPPLRSSQSATLVDANIERLESRLRVKITDMDRQRFSRIFDETLSSRLQTVRSINRFFAQLEVLTPDLAGDVDIVDFVLVTWLRVFEPRLYAALYVHRSWALGVRGGSLWAVFSQQQKDDAGARHRALMERVSSAGVDSEHIDDVAILLGSLFPALKSDLVEQQSRYTPEVQPVGRRRIADPDYFDRYFAYLVPAEDVSDGLVDRGVDDIDAGLRDSRDLKNMAEALASHGTLTARKIQDRSPVPSHFAAWISEVVDGRSADADEIDDTDVLSHLLQWNLLRLPQADFERAIDDLRSTPARRQELIRFGTRLRRGRETTAMYARISMGDIEAFWVHLCTVLPPILSAELETGMTRSALDASASFFEMVWLQEDITPGSAKVWLRNQWISGHWRLIDELGRLVHSGSTSERPGVSVLDHLSEEDFLAHFDPDEVARVLNNQLAAAPDLLRHDWNLEDTAENRVAVALDDVRGYLAKRATTSESD